MVDVEHVRARSQNGGEILTRPGMDLVQKGRLLAAGRLPVARERDPASVGEREAGDVDGVAEGVFGEPGAWPIVDRAAAIGAEDVDGRDLPPEARLSVRLDDIVEPGLQRRNHRAIDGQNLVEPDRSVVEGGDLERARHAANAWTVDLSGRNHVGRRGDELAGIAGVFGLGPPDRPLGPAEEPAARERGNCEQPENDRPNATRHRAKLRLFL